MDKEMTKTIIYSLLIGASILIFINIQASGQEIKNFSIEYRLKLQGKDYPDWRKVMIIKEGNAMINTPDNNKEYIASKPETAAYIIPEDTSFYETAVVNSGQRFSVKRPIEFLKKEPLKGDALNILGFECYKTEIVSFSNHYEIWHTKDTGIMASPLPSLGIPNGLVLKIVRNGNFEIYADSICYNDSFTMPKNWGELVESIEYRHLLDESFIERIPVFNNTSICWGYEGKNPDADGVFHYGNGTVVVKKIAIPDFPVDYSCFLKLTEQSNGDAYDRVGSIFTIPCDDSISFMDAFVSGVESLPIIKLQDNEYQGITKTNWYSPPLELMRFFTPFGVGHYNDKREVYGREWEDKVVYKQDISELIPVLKDEIWIGAFIGNYDKGGHTIDLELIFYPEEDEIKEDTENSYWVSPLFNTLNILEAEGQNYGTIFQYDSLKLEYDVPEGLETLTLRYTTTGHGGWGGGDEFNKKTNKIFINDSLTFTIAPWRCDCANYRNYNPSSGNFWNGMSSSDYSRSGWCPGSSADPFFVEINPRPGKYTMKVAIPIGQKAGNSFSSWNISGILIGKYKKNTEY